MSKRKASIPSDSPFYKPPKRAKVSPEDLGHASIDFEEADGVSSDYSCYNDANPPDHNMKEDNPRSETFQFRDKKTAERWMELVWIVRAKENFEQDPSGPPGLSTTTGPLTNAQLRDAFNLRFNKNVGTEACMKRYRNDKQRVYDAFPGWPRGISYTSRQARHQKQPKTNGSWFEYVHEATYFTDIQTDTNGHHESNIEGQSWNKQEAGTYRDALHDEVLERYRRKVEAGDLRRYVEHSWEMPKNEHEPWVRIMLADSSERYIGSVAIPAKDLLSSQAYVEFREHTNAQEIWLTGISIATLQRYVQSISPVRLARLPEYEFSLKARGSNPANAVASCTRLVWSFEATVELYELATQMRDCHVRNLILDHWRSQLRANCDYEVGLVELQQLFDRLATDDPALQFWAQALQALLPSDGHREDFDLFRSNSCASFFVANGLKDWSDDRFHRQYHRCLHQEGIDGKCRHVLNSHTKFVYTLDELSAIAQRLLWSEGWHKDMQRGFNIIKERLFNKYSSL